MELSYFFDPFCGWCYASAPALTALAAAYPDALRLMPVGLFAGREARPMAAIADYAWENDQRIAQLTGQRFTQAYHDQVLRHPAALFNSQAATSALVALGLISRSLETPFLHGVQIARYVDGQDTAKADVVAAVAVEVAAGQGITLEVGALAERLASDRALAAQTAARISQSQGLMNQLGLSGVPQLLVRSNGRQAVLSGAALYRGGAAILAALSDLAAQLNTASA